MDGVLGLLAGGHRHGGEPRHRLRVPRVPLGHPATPGRLRLHARFGRAAGQGHAGLPPPASQRDRQDHHGVRDALGPAEHPGTGHAGAGLADREPPRGGVLAAEFPARAPPHEILADEDRYGLRSAREPRLSWSGAWSYVATYRSTVKARRASPWRSSERPDGQRPHQCVQLPDHRRWLQHPLRRSFSSAGWVASGANPQPMDPRGRPRRGSSCRSPPRGPSASPKNRRFAALAAQNVTRIEAAITFKAMQLLDTVRALATVHGEVSPLVQAAGAAQVYDIPAITREGRHLRRGRVRHQRRRRSRTATATPPSRTVVRAGLSTLALGVITTVRRSGEGAINARPACAPTASNQATKNQVLAGTHARHRGRGARPATSPTSATRGSLVGPAHHARFGRRPGLLGHPGRLHRRRLQGAARCSRTSRSSTSRPSPSGRPCRPDQAD